MLVEDPLAEQQDAAAVQGMYHHGSTTHLWPRSAMKEDPFCCAAS